MENLALFGDGLEIETELVVGFAQVLCKLFLEAVTTGSNVRMTFPPPLPWGRRKETSASIIHVPEALDLTGLQVATELAHSRWSLQFPCVGTLVYFFLHLRWRGVCVLRRERISCLERPKSFVA